VAVCLHERDLELLNFYLVRVVSMSVDLLGVPFDSAIVPKTLKPTKTVKFHHCHRGNRSSHRGRVTQK
jgi:hypothetical protein